MNISKIMNKCYLLLLVVVFNPMTNLTAVAQEKVMEVIQEQSCETILIGRHYSISNNDFSLINTLIKPRVASACQDITSLRYDDSHYTLFSTNQNQDHYFNWNNWTFKNKGDGGVDVTGAPSKILVEGANNTQFNTTPGSLLRLSIAIPAEGYVNFDWRKVGSSNISLHVSINGKKQTVTEGNFLSDLLRAGDQFTLELDSAAESFNAISINNFEFLTNATGVIKRQWMASDLNGKAGEFAQFIAIRRASIANLVLPKNMDGVEAPMLKQGASTNPSTTGYPMFDQDGDLHTKFDQINITDDKFGFTLNWKDEVQVISGKKTIIRHWVINDKHFGNKMKQKQIIKLVEANRSSQKSSAFHSEFRKPQPSYKIEFLTNHFKMDTAQQPQLTTDFAVNPYHRVLQLFGEAIL